MKKGFIKKVIAMLCVGALVFGNIGPYIQNVANVSAEEGDKEVTFSSWGFTPGPIEKTTGYSVADTTVTSMDGVAFSGTIKVPDGVVFYIGGQSTWKGVMAWIRSHDTAGAIINFSTAVDNMTACGADITQGEIQEKLADSSFKLLNNEYKLGLKFSKYGENNLTIDVYINDVYIKTVDYTNGIFQGMGTYFTIYPNGGTVTIADAKWGSDVLTIQKTGAISAEDLGDVTPADITSIKVNAGVTEIASGTFDGFNNLESVYLPNTLTKVADDAFKNCPEGVTLRYAINKEFTGGLVNPDIHPYYSFKCLTLGSSYGEDTNTYIYKLAKNYFASLSDRAEGDSDYDEIVIAELFTGGGTLAQRVQAIMGTPNASCYYEKWDKNGISVPTTADGQLSKELMIEALQDEYWDTIILMQSADDSAKQESFETKTNGTDADMDAVIAFAKENNINHANAKYYWLQTWSYNYKLNDSNFTNACTYSEAMRQNIVKSMQESVQKRVDSGALSGIIPAGAGLENLKGSCVNVADPNFDYDGKTTTGLYNGGSWSSLFAVQRDTAHASCGLGRFTLGLTAFSYLAGLDDTEIATLSESCYPKSLEEYEITDKLKSEQASTGAYLGYEEATKEAAPLAAYAAIKAIENPYTVSTEGYHPYEGGVCPLCQSEDTYHELTFGDWGAPTGHLDASSGPHTLTDTSITSLDGVAFNGMIKTAGQVALYFGDKNNGGWGGIMVNVVHASNEIAISSAVSGYSGGDKVTVDTIRTALNDTDFQLTDEFKLRLTFDIDADNNLTLGVYINDTYVQTVNFNNGIGAALGTLLYIYNVSKDLTLHNVYRELTFSDWGAPTGHLDASSGPHTLTDTSITSLDGVAFNGMIKTAGQVALYFGDKNNGGWGGIMVNVVHASNEIAISSAVSGYSGGDKVTVDTIRTALNDTDFQLTDEFKLRLTFDIDADNNLTLGVYINDTYVQTVNFSNGIGAALGNLLYIYNVSKDLTLGNVVMEEAEETVTQSGALTVDYRSAGGSTAGDCRSGVLYFKSEDDTYSAATTSTQMSALSGEGAVKYNGREVIDYTLTQATTSVYRLSYSKATTVGDTLTIYGTFTDGSNKITFEKTTFVYAGISSNNKGYWILDPYDSGALTVHTNISQSGTASVGYNTLLFKAADATFVEALKAAGVAGTAALTAVSGSGKIYSNDVEISGATFQIDNTSLESSAAYYNTFRLKYDGNSTPVAGDTITIEGIFYNGNHYIDIEKTTFIWMGYTGGANNTNGWWMLQREVLPEEDVKSILETAGYTRVTVPDFGAMTYKAYTGFSSDSYMFAETLDKTYLDVNVTFTDISSEGMGYIRYGSSDGWHCVNVARNGAKLAVGLESVGMTSILPQQVGLNSFDNVNIKIALDCGTFTDSADGTYQLADYTVSIWVNNRKVVEKQVKEQQQYAGTKLAVYVAENADVTDEAIILDMDYEDVTRQEASYDLDKGNYLVSGTSKVLKAGEEISLTDYSISMPGDYEIITTVEEERTYYHKNVAIYYLGDVNLNGTVAEQSDLDALESIYTSTSFEAKTAAELAADLDHDGLVDAEDWKLMKQILVAEDPDTELQAVKKQYYPAIQTYDFLDNAANDKDVMPIVGYYGPFNNIGYNFLTNYYFDLVKQSGVNLISYSHNGASSDTEWSAVKKTLSLAENKGLGWFLNDDSLSTITDAKGLADAIGRYGYFDSFLGIHIVDEPVYKSSTQVDLGNTDSLLDNYTDVSQQLNSYSNLTGFINLAPTDSSYVNKKILGTVTTDYVEAYIKQYINDAKPTVLSMDDYPFNDDSDEGVTNAGGYFRSLTKMRQESVNNAIPFWWYVQAGGNFKKTNETGYTYNAALAATEEETYWNVNTALAFGAKGIEWFTLIQPGDFHDSNKGNQLNGLIDANGYKTEFYDYATAINTHITNVDEVLMKAESKGIITTGGYAQSEIKDGVDANSKQNSAFVSPIIAATDTSRLTEVTSVDATTGQADDYGSIIGCFDYRDMEAYYVVNYNVTSDTSQKITLKFDGNYHYRIIQQGENSVSVLGESCELTIPAGEAVLVVLDEVSGDANGDGQFDSRDLVRHKRVEAEEARVEFSQGYYVYLDRTEILDMIKSKHVRYFLVQDWWDETLPKLDLVDL